MMDEPATVHVRDGICGEVGKPWCSLTAFVDSLKKRKRVDVTDVHSIVTDAGNERAGYMFCVKGLTMKVPRDMLASVRALSWQWIYKTPDSALRFACSRFRCNTTTATGFFEIVHYRHGIFWCDERVSTDLSMLTGLRYSFDDYGSNVLPTSFSQFLCASTTTVRRYWHAPFVWRAMFARSATVTYSIVSQERHALGPITFPIVHGQRTLTIPIKKCWTRCEIRVCPTSLSCS